MPIAAMAYALHLLSLPSGWTTPQQSSPIFTRPSEATIGENGTVAVILASLSSSYEVPQREARQVQYPPQRVLIVRPNWTTTNLQAFTALKTQPFRRHIATSDCAHDQRSCPYFTAVALAGDGTPFVTLEYPFSGAYSGALEAALRWNGSWHVVPDEEPFDHAGDPSTPTNVTIGGADTPYNFAFNGDFADAPFYDDSVHRKGYYRNIAAVHFGSQTVQLGLVTVTALRGAYVVGADAGLGVEGRPPGSPTTALLWRCVTTIAAIHPCVRTELGPGTAYAVDSAGEAVGDDAATLAEYDFGVALRGNGRPTLWRDGKAFSLSENYGSAFAISDAGTIVGTFGAPRSGLAGFVADAHAVRPTAVPLDSMVENLAGRHITAALGVAGDGRILALVNSDGESYRLGSLALLHDRLAVLVPVASP